MKIVRSGVTRTVILTKRFAIKIPTGRGVWAGGKNRRLAGVCRGILANLSEVEWSQWHGDKVCSALRSFTGLINVYPRCQEIEEDEKFVIPLLSPSPGDMKFDNYGILDGRVVRLDYDIS